MDTLMVNSYVFHAPVVASESWDLNTLILNDLIT